MADDAQKEHAQRIIDDPRSNAQINVETLIVAVRAGVAADRSRLPGRAPAVRVVTTADTVATRTVVPVSSPGGPTQTESGEPKAPTHPAPIRRDPAGLGPQPESASLEATPPNSDLTDSVPLTAVPTTAVPTTAVPTTAVPTAAAQPGTAASGVVQPDTAPSGVAQPNAVRPRSAHLDESGDPVSLQTLERLICDGATVNVSIDPSGQVVAFGTEQRLFTSRQRVALAVRDGGCRVQGCSRPPSWCEAHHVEWYKRDKGKTEIANGILLCRHHHMLIHNNGWEIIRDGGTYWLRPPASVDPAQKLRPMPSKNPIITAIQASNRSARSTAEPSTPTEPKL